jgi:hypothetical protein
MNSIHKQTRAAAYYQKHRKRLLAQMKEYQRTHKEQIKIQLQKYYSDPDTYKKVREKDRIYNRKRAREIKIGIRPKPVYSLQEKIKHNLRNRLLFQLKKNKTKKSISAIALLGCTVDEFKRHIESRFTEGMTWENHGIYKANDVPKWHFDHIVPCCSFDLTDIEQQKKCFHYTNIQPLWGFDNIKKGGKREPGN